MSLTCVIASHISSIARLNWLREAITSASFCDKIILSISYKDEFSEIVENYKWNTFAFNFKLKVVIHSYRKTQFQHIETVSKFIKTDNVIFCDDDDYFLPNAKDIVKTLMKLYTTNPGIQYEYDIDVRKFGNIVTDFSGTFCTTEMLINFLKEYSDYIEVYDCDCTFIKYLLDNTGRYEYHVNNGYGKHEYYVIRRLHDEVHDWHGSEES